MGKQTYRFLYSYLMAAVAGASLLLISPRSAAEDRIAYLIKELKTSKDFRVRTQAAVSLGQTKSSRAVKPLCSALSDSEEAVRGVSAKSLGIVGEQSALPCLTKHKGSEKNSAVLKKITEAIKNIKKQFEIPTGAKAYVAIGQVKNQTSRSHGEVSDLVQSAMKTSLHSMKGVAVAPSGQSKTEASKVITKKRLKGYQLDMKVEKLVYKGDALTVKVRMIMSSYPGKSIQGEIARTLTQTGSTAGDTSSENELIQMAVTGALESFEKIVKSL
jgi:hypothetical protein